jgi:hypothetical protein
MPSRHWFEPVAICESPSARHGVSSVEEAAEWLLFWWPEEHQKDQEQLVARKICLAALEGTSTVEAARSAFVMAAERAGLVVH